MTVMIWQKIPVSVVLSCVAPVSAIIPLQPNGSIKTARCLNGANGAVAGASSVVPGREMPPSSGLQDYNRIPHEKLNKKCTGTKKI